MEDGLRVVDTDLAIDFLRDRSPGADRVQGWLERDLVRFSAVTALELRLGTDFTRGAGNIGRLLVVRTLPLDRAAAHRERGLRSPAQDRLDIGLNHSPLAGMCLRYDLPLATRNTLHFARVKGLRLID